MTELEKKAEEYVKNKILILGRYNTDIQQAFTDGYKQGQKDTFKTYDSEVNKMSDDYSYRLKQLQKENEELKATISILETPTEKNSETENQLSRNSLQLKKENEELKEKLKNEIAFNEQSEIIQKYKAQIKKIKKIMELNDYCENVYHYLSCELDLYKVNSFDCEVCRYAECSKRQKQCELE